MKEPDKLKSVMSISCMEQSFTANVKITKFTHFVVVSFSEVSLLFSCLIFCDPTWGPRSSGGPGSLNRLNPRFLCQCQGTKLVYCVNSNLLVSIMSLDSRHC